MIWKLLWFFIVLFRRYKIKRDYINNRAGDQFRSNNFQEWLGVEMNDVRQVPDDLRILETKFSKFKAKLKFYKFMAVPLQ